VDLVEWKAVRIVGKLSVGVFYYDEGVTVKQRAVFRVFDCIAISLGDIHRNLQLGRTKLGNVAVEKVRGLGRTVA
jgi:hypothetical protein